MIWIDAQVAAKCEQQVATSVWVPDRIIAVAGSSNNIDMEVKLLECESLGVEVLRRAGGGGAVVLYPGCVVVGIGLWVESVFRNDSYFALINRTLCKALRCVVPGLAITSSGISDLGYRNQKVAGTSMFRSRNYLLYQASILVDEPDISMSRLLNHPSKEPEYRRGRVHEDFLCYLGAIDARFSCVSITQVLRERLVDLLEEELVDELITPKANQIEHIRKRFGAVY